MNFIKNVVGVFLVAIFLVFLCGCKPKEDFLTKYIGEVKNIEVSYELEHYELDETLKTKIINTLKTAKPNKTTNDDNAEKLNGQIGILITNNEYEQFVIYIRNDGKAQLGQEYFNRKEIFIDKKKIDALFKDFEIMAHKLTSYTKKIISIDEISYHNNIPGYHYVELSSSEKKDLVDALNTATVSNEITIESEKYYDFYIYITVNVVHNETYDRPIKHLFIISYNENGNFQYIKFNDDEARHLYINKNVMNSILTKINKYE